MPTVLTRDDPTNDGNSYSLQMNASQIHPHYSTKKPSIVIPSCVKWKSWKPGCEYIKHLLIKNIQTKTQRVTYEVPETRHFRTLYPKPIILKPGTHYSLPITFHPLETKVYRDVLKCHTNNEHFSVVLLGPLPFVQITLPKSIMMPRCTLHGCVQKSFELKNVGELPVPIKWLFTEPFEIKPEECTMDPGTICSFDVFFRPKLAKLYEGMMICQFGSDEIKYKKMRIIAQGKYPHLLASISGTEEEIEECVEGLKTTVSFNNIPVGATVQKSLTLKNVSLVEVHFKILYPLVNIDNRLEVVFDVPIKYGVVPPLSSVELPVLFYPGIVNTVYVDYFHVLPLGGLTKNIIKCIGNSVGPKVSLQPDFVDFMKIDLGKSIVNSIELTNNTDVPANFQFLIDSKISCFQFSSAYGTVQPQSSVKISIKFCPLFAMNYYRRITCLIHNQDPLFLDLLGTCHSEKINPAVVRKEHVKKYEIKCSQGFSTLPPDQLNELMEKNAMRLDLDGRVLVPETPKSECENEIDTMAAYFASNPTTEECMGRISDPPVTIDINEAHFGRCTSLRTTFEKMLCVTNNTRGKVCVQWIIGNQKIFTVHPSFMEIASLKSGIFKVFFNPDIQNQLFGAELECYIYFKCMMDYRFITDKTFCPPWCFPLKCTGHTFSPENEMFIAKHIILDKMDLYFPSTALQEVAYKTILISNTGTTPLFYEFENDPSGIFCIRPSQGSIESGHQICVARFAPKEKQLYEQILNLKFNDNKKSTKSIRLVGQCENPDILLENGGEIYFKPTCIGTSSKSHYSFKNQTQKILNFKWSIKITEEKEIAMIPNYGQILPNDSFNHECIFSPLMPGKKIYQWKLNIWSDDSPENISSFQVRALGTATSGEILAEPSYYNFGDIVVGRLAQSSIVLYNNGSCNLVCQLLVQQTANGEEITFSEDKAIHLSEWEIDMPAKSKHLIKISVRPSFQASYRFAISYQLILEKEQVKDPSLLEAKHLCHLLMNGVFPSLIVTDIRGQESAKEISKRQLWTLFSLDTLNSYLCSDPSYQELMYSIETQKTTERLPAFNTQAIVELNFSAAPLHSPPSTFVIQLENNSTVPAEWAFLFPDDMRLEVEPWADTADLNDEELHQMKVIENKLFMIEPKTGCLKPGEGKAITMTYNHMLAGTDRLNVLLKVVNGREILLNFVGVTVELDRHYIHFHSNKYTFIPMPVGKIHHPIQIYELYNGGAQTIHYKVDIRPLIQLEKQNYNHTVFQCRNPCGSLSPGKTAYIEWKFSPLECMTYSVDVPIHIEEGETALITFIGIGYDAEAMGQTMPFQDTSLNMNIPDSQSVTIPGQIVGLSKECISLGNIPLFAMKRALVFINNWSTDRQVSFNWQFTSRDDVRLLSVNPVKGLLQPKESKLCQLSFRDCGLPGFYDIDLICEVTDETEVTKYEEELRLWEAERNRQQVEFTLTEKSRTAVTPELNDIELIVSPGRLSPFLNISEDRSAMEENLVSYKTLPPIRQIPIDKQMDMARHTRRSQKKKYWKKPQPPAYSILHLGITARTYNVEEFEVGHVDEYRHYFFDNENSQLNMEGSKAIRIERKYSEVLIVCSGLHRQMLCGVLSNIIRALLVDTYFHDALKSLQYEKIPYYQQVAQDLPVPVILKNPSSEDLEKKLISRRVSSDGMSSQLQVNEICTRPNSPMNYITSPVPYKFEDTAGSQGKTEGYDAESLIEKEKLKHLDDFSSFVEYFLESCLLGIMQEAMEREFNITAPSRFIALPKKSGVGSSASSSRV